MALFSRIKETAKEQGLLLKDVAEKVGTTAANMTRWDKNRPSVDKVVSAAQVLNVSVDYLLELTDEKTPAANGCDGLSPARAEMLEELSGMSEDEIYHLLDVIRLVKKK